MSMLIITRGLPGCGKTTRARMWVAEDPAHRARINRDDLRAQLHDGVHLEDRSTERQVIAARDAAIAALLKRGVDVVCDDTNLPQRTARDLRKLATLTGADFTVWDLTEVPLETCIARDAARDRTVGEKVIRDMHQRYLAGKSYPLPLPEESTGGDTGPVPYVAPEGRPDAILVDIDGTTAIMCARSPYDETRVNEDTPNWPVIAAVEAMAATHRVVFLSGRTDACRPATEEWLAKHVPVAYDGLFMRPAGDMRKDSIVKVELFDQHVRHNYRVRFVLDDRRQVVDAWRAMGLTVFQVAPGDF